jgi:lipopolysaccharide transport system ATP-binding protein
MSDTVISVENVSKYYRLGLIGGGTLRADCERWWARVRGKPDPTRKIDQRSNVPTLEGSNEIWVLRDVSFEVKQGEVVGIPSTELRACPECNEGTGIGRNGAGKSTLTSAQLSARLKILSRITEPTSGRAEMPY